MWDNANYRPNQKALRKWAKKHLNPWCNECGRRGKLELDHIVNVKAGGTDDPENLQWLCPRCHNRKTQKEATKSRNAWKRQPEEHPALRHKNMPPSYYDEDEY